MKTLVLIDGANNAAALKLMGKQLNWDSVREWCTSTFGFITHFNYYTAVLTQENGEVRIRKMLDYMAHNGYCVIEKAAKRYGQDDDTFKVKGNMDVEIATDLLLHARNVDQIVLFTGDNDFAYAVRAAQLMGTRVILVSTKEGNFSGSDIRKCVDEFIELRDIFELIGQERKEKKEVVVQSAPQQPEAFKINV